MADTLAPFPARPTLTGSDVHVLQFPLTVGDPDAAIALLDDAERDRARRFHADHHRHAFIAAHAAMRIALGRCAGMPPEALRFRNSPSGKPELVDPPFDLRFNLTHSGDVGMLAVAVGRAVGIDVERERPIEIMAIAKRFFSPSEQAALAATPEDQRLSAFYRCWTRKESFIKASGDGLSRDLSAFDMSTEDIDGPVLLACRDVPTDMERWTTVPLRTDSTYAAAVTVEGHEWRVTQWSGLGKPRMGSGLRARGSRPAGC